jgi:hypothetical protein
MRFQWFMVPAVALFVSNLGIRSAVGEELHATGQAEMQAAIAMQVDSQAAQREAIQALLTHPEVERIVASVGLDLTQAQAAAAHLDGEELQRLAAQAAAVNAQLAGGDTIVIAASTLIIILLIVLLLMAI